MSLLVLGAGGLALAVPGNNDASFGNGGIVTARFADPLGRGIFSSSFARAVAVQPDGRILVAGAVGEDHGLAFGLARFLANGALDPNFGSGGTTSTDFADFRNETANGILLQADGKIVVAGTAEAQSGSGHGNFALARYNVNGILDTTFLINGKGITDLGGDDRASAIAIQADGKIVVAGSTGGNFALVRYNPNGTLDATFDGDGKLTTDFGGNDGANAVSIQPDGRIIAVGSTLGSSQQQFALSRYNSNGSLYTGFADLGKRVGLYECCVTHPNATANAIAIQADGKFVIAGTSGNDFGLARLTSTGGFDSSWPGGGLIHTDISASSIDAASAVAIQVDGKIVAAGSSTDSTGTRAIAVASYNSNGSLDTTFAGTGRRRAYASSPVIGCTRDEASAIAIQKIDGRVVVAGSTSLPCSDVGPSVVVARFHAFACGVKDVTILGTNGPDTMSGTVVFNSRQRVFVAQADVIHGLGGDDTIDGGGGDDTICGGDGNDILYGRDGTDALFGGAGINILSGGEGTDTCVSAPSDEFWSCEAFSAGGSGFSGDWEDASDHCNRSERNFECRIKATLAVTNPGTEETVVPALIAFYLSADDVWDESDAFLTIVEIGRLAPGSSKTVPLHLGLPSGLDPSGQSLIAVLDFLDSVPEVHEDNNVVVSAPLP